MTIHSEPCSYCQGSGHAERWMTATVEGMNEVVRADSCDPDLVQAISAGRCDGVHPQWEETDCPACHGAGQREFESTPCRIF